jgi:threonine dehydratase
LIYYEGLSKLIGAEIYIQHENHNPTGNFKICGGTDLMHHLKRQCINGVITFSTGNHGLSIATAQAEDSPAAYNSWKANTICHASNSTFVGGFATGKAYEVPFAIYKDGLDDFFLVSEDEIYDAVGLALYYTHNLAEGSRCIVDHGSLQDQREIERQKGGAPNERL